MTALHILLALLALILVGCTLLFYYACVGKRVDDMWDEGLVRKHGFGMLWEDIRSGKDWLNKQPVQPLQAVSYDGKLLNGIFVPCENARATILLFHGWRSSWKLDFSSVFEYYNSLGLNIIAVSQRGQGESEGRFITFGIRERHDVLSWVTYASQLFGEEHPLFLDGVSMGAATVLMAADFDYPANVRGILADSGFISPYAIMESVIKRKYPFIPVKPTLWLLNVFTRVFAGFGLNEYSTLQALKGAKYPVLFVHGTADNFVPAEMSKQNYKVCASDKDLILVDGADHALSYYTDRKRVQAALEAFIDKHI